MTSTKFPRIAVADIQSKGKGVIAKERICRGTLIVSEKPRITFPAGLDELGVLHAVLTLSQRDLEFFFSFPCEETEDPDLGRLKHFTPCFKAGRKFASGLYQTICRVNHTCHSPKGAPNAVFVWNDTRGEEELRALKDIHQGQEIEVSYMENVANYEDPLPNLRRTFGFECSCPGCTRPASEREAL
ncbi:hypothetical protein C8R43DRAFT_1156670 [Mycena crocata]|nr:hypothetical protein C8R43DRAFT_1156670 [Mycena crocata]